jgi:hypothetical protein
VAKECPGERISQARGEREGEPSDVTLVTLKQFLIDILINNENNHLPFFLSLAQKKCIKFVNTPVSISSF